jgi:hypothetical protein
MNGRHERVEEERKAYSLLMGKFEARRLLGELVGLIIVSLGEL